MECAVKACCRRQQERLLRKQEWHLRKNNYSCDYVNDVTFVYKSYPISVAREQVNIVC